VSDHPVTASPSPLLFEAVVGQERAVSRLVDASRRPVHAYLLHGPPGSGKRAAARGLAAALLCGDGGCGTCNSCRRALAGTHPDLVTIERTG
jgi:DNA polymerase-3 subunit delta'